MLKTLVSMAIRMLFLLGNLIIASIISMYILTMACPLAYKILFLLLLNIAIVAASILIPINTYPFRKLIIVCTHGFILGMSIYVAHTIYSSSLLALMTNTLKIHVLTSLSKRQSPPQLPSNTSILTNSLSIIAQTMQCKNNNIAAIRNLRVNHFIINFFRLQDLYFLLHEIFSQKTYLFSSTNPNPFIIDCGGNIGIAVLFFKTLYPNATILSFEPHPQTFAILQKNIEANHLKNVTLINKALLDKQGEINFPAYENKSGFPGMSLFNTQNCQASATSITISSDKLSHYINQQVDLLKIDTEGAEGAIINDLEQAHKFNFIREMIIEYHVRNASINESLGHIIQILESNNYDIAIHGGITPPFDKNQQQTLLIYAKCKLSQNQ